MKILYVTDGLLSWGGLERVLVEKMNYLADNYGYDVYLSTANQGISKIRYPLSLNVHHHDLGIFFYEKYKYHGLLRIYKGWKMTKLYEKKLRAQIIEIKPDIIIYTRLYMIDVLLRVKGQHPLIIESHSGCLSYKYYSNNMIQKLKERHYLSQAKNAQMIITLTEGDAVDWRHFNKNVIVLSNIVHINCTGKYSDCMAKSIIFVGRYSKQKDLGALLNIWEIVHRVHPDWTLQLYGSYGEEHQRLREVVNRDDLNICIHQPTPDIFDAYIRNSILIMTSLFEPFGLVLPEAMSCGLPVVSFDCPYGPADIISDSVDGFLIPNRDIHLFAEKVCLLIENKELRCKMGKAGVLSSRRFSVKRIMPQWKTLFDELCTNK